MQQEHGTVQAQFAAHRIAQAALDGGACSRPDKRATSAVTSAGKTPPSTSTGERRRGVHEYNKKSDLLPGSASVKKDESARRFAQGAGSGVIGRSTVEVCHHCHPPRGSLRRGGPANALRGRPRANPRGGGRLDHWLLQDHRRLLHRRRSTRHPPAREEGWVWNPRWEPHHCKSPQCPHKRRQRRRRRRQRRRRHAVAAR